MIAFTSKPVIVLPIHDSETYILTRCLELLGLKNTHWKIEADSWQDLSQASLNEARSELGHFRTEEPAEAVLTRIPPACFAVAHLNPNILAGHSRLQPLFLYRNLRDVLPPYCDWFAQTQSWTNRLQWHNVVTGTGQLAGFLEEHGNSIALHISELCHGVLKCDIPAISYESIAGLLGKEVQTMSIRWLASLLDIPVPLNPLLIAKSASEPEALTRYPEAGHSRRSFGPWSEEYKTFFVDSGIMEVNRLLGYENLLVSEMKARYQFAAKSPTSCAVCASSSWKPLIEFDRYGIGTKICLCSTCGHVQITPRPETEWFNEFYRDHYWKIYSRSDFEFEYKQGQSRYLEILTAILPHLNESPKTLLDVGCGIGGLHGAAKSILNNPYLIGTDPSLDAVEKVLEIGYNEIHHTAWSDHDRPILERPPDLALMVHVLEHVNDPRSVLCNLRMALTDSSFFYVEVPDILSPKWHGINFFHIAHINYFNRFGLERLLTETGYFPVHRFEGPSTQWPWAIGILCRNGSTRPRQENRERNTAAQVKKAIRLQLPVLDSRLNALVFRLNRTARRRLSSRTRAGLRKIHGLIVRLLRFSPRWILS